MAVLVPLLLLVLVIYAAIAIDRRFIRKGDQ